MRLTSILATGLFAALCAPALAQSAAPACKGYYTVGETVPAGCTQQTINASNYASWGSGQPAITTTTAPVLFNPHSRGFMGR